MRRQRSEWLERSFAHAFETGGMRTLLCGYRIILKRLLAHAGGFNRGLVMRALIGTDSPRGLQDRLPAVAASLASWILVLGGRSTAP